MTRYEETEAPAEPRVLVVATSLNADSKSFLLAQAAYEHLRAREIDAELLSLRGLDLPFAGEGDADERADVRTVKAAFARATHILLALPIYNGDVSAATRNLLNLGCNFHEKTVGFLCAAGGPRSYMAVVPLGNALMFDFRAWIVPSYVYAYGPDFDGARIANPEIEQRIARLVADLLSRGPVPARAA
ncbi:MAG: NAD(P)H-dependent oxidoreductase [Planctomycetota bacterium]|nr:NAD(P)H-dependent oxidoreductase [Planctomycetota bacterium]